MCEVKVVELYTGDLMLGRRDHVIALHALSFSRAAAEHVRYCIRVSMINAQLRPQAKGVFDGGDRCTPVDTE